MADEDGSVEPTLKAHRWEMSSSASAAPTTSRWGAGTPRQRGGDTPKVVVNTELSAWRGHATPTPSAYAMDPAKTPTMRATGGATPVQGGQTPMFGGQTPVFGGQTPAFGSGTPMFTGATPAAGMAFGATPNYQFEGTTPVQSHFAGGESQSAVTANIGAQARKLEMQWRVKNKRLTEEYLDSILPPEFKLVEPPADYNPPPTEEPNFYELASKSLDVFVVNQNSDAAASMTYDIPESLGDGMPQMQTQDAPVFEVLLKYHNVNPIPDEVLPSYMLMKNLFKIKNGDTNQRRIAMRYLLDKARIFGSGPLFQFTFHVWRSGILDVIEQHYYVDLVKGAISRLQKDVRGSSKEIVHMMEVLLSAQERVLRDDGKEVLILLTRVVGYEAVFEAIKEDFAHAESGVRRHTAKVVAIIAFAVGPEIAIKIIHGMSLSPVALARQTSARAITEMATILMHAITGELVELVPIFEKLLRDEPRVKREAASALAHVAEATYPYGIEELDSLVYIVREECKRGIGTTTGLFVRAFGALIPLMAPYDAQKYTSDMLPTLVNQFNTPDDEHRRVLLQVVRQCVSADGVTVDFIRNVILRPFFEGFWTIRRVAADRKTAGILIDTTVGIARRIGSTEILQYLVQDMKDENEHFQRMVVETVRRVIANVGAVGVPDTLVALLMDGAIAAVKQDETGLNRVVMEGLATICNALGTRLKRHLRQIFDLIKSRRDMPGMIRMQAAELAARIATTVKDAGGALFLQDLGRSLFDRLEDDEAAVMSANLKATRVILVELGAARYQPPVRELLKKLMYIIPNRNSNVQLNTILLVEEIATNCDEDVEAIHLQELATKGLFELLDAHRRETRRACTRTFGVIARKIRPFAIILELVDNFKQDKRKIRICTAVALGAIARECGAFTVIPYLLNESKICEGEQVATIVQHSILKAVRYIFEAIGAAGKDFVYPLVPLLVRALTEMEIQHRRMAVEACRSIVLAVAGNDGFEDLVIHFLNFIHPNIVELLSRNETKISEERLKMVTAVVGYYEAARLVIGSGKLFQYLLQGLFHPAKKVRDIYRRTYNMVYMASPEALVPYYPRLGDDNEHTYVRHELEVLL
ncbi:splicing factor 3B subunit 1, putative [Trypanosoma equiperdum]|uniref:Splicing factor 3B subunit 1, putative n=3 Tax=Trypanozoon TaxID=39700 RepID=Q382Z6_TRYB2|nr:splicing factor 3B subunit 1, putative [Trypanosoma brucei gambiense DAL972]XP_829247.1 splicing factor 3B subunit 1, putative [Trypanosoma brucei brucei TREU927]EAN80135.1 splicing factor 3B subunit 1, putative [Trypanosoma brucei brucei TREU927]CBH18212.1 splicing factor 3B subunit 1, putative [Trypanosoma brucei gambiense DAL972]SCU65784.1 splicing factor 3B subunit 1, putative [Trypanosoma equiperdum]|eukprot:XP_011780476.1 splicing factor 3B subunit 1, putative [Trypanosoma brucei gambiense DAL972]